MVFPCHRMALTTFHAFQSADNRPSAPFPCQSTNNVRQTDASHTVCNHGRIVWPPCEVHPEKRLPFCSWRVSTNQEGFPKRRATISTSRFPACHLIYSLQREFAYDRRHTPDILRQRKNLPNAVPIWRWTENGNADRKNAGLASWWIDL